MSEDSNTVETALLRMLKEDGKVIPYRPKISRIVGTTSAILLQQIYFRYEGRPFYKLKSPCSLPQYKVGDSWSEELGFLPGEFDTALKRISTKCTKGKSKTELMEQCPDIPRPKTTETKKQYMKRLSKVLKYLVIYWTDSNRLTWYHFNQELFAKLLIAIYIDKLDYSIYGLNGELQFSFVIDSKNTIIEKDLPPTASGDGAASNDDIEWNDSTHTNTLQDYVDDSLQLLDMSPGLTAQEIQHAADLASNMCPDCHEIIHDGTCLCDSPPNVATSQQIANGVIAETLLGEGVCDTCATHGYEYPECIDIADKATAIAKATAVAEDCPNFDNDLPKYKAGGCAAKYDNDLACLQCEFSDIDLKAQPPTKTADLVATPSPTMQGIDGAIYGTRPVVGDSELLQNVQQLGVESVQPPKAQKAKPRYPIGDSPDNDLIDEPTPKPKAKKARKPKLTPEQKQTKANIWEAVKFTWRLDDNAAWKLAKLQQFFLGTIKKAGKYKDFFDVQLEIPANALEVIAFGHWYKTEYDNVSMPESGPKLRSHFETFRGSGERYQVFMRKAINTVREKLPKIIIEGVTDNRPDELGPDGEPEKITEEQRQHALQIMADLEKNFGKGGVE